MTVTGEFPSVKETPSWLDVSPLKREQATRVSNLQHVNSL